MQRCENQEAKKGKGLVCDERRKYFLKKYLFLSFFSSHLAFKNDVKWRQGACVTKEERIFFRIILFISFFSLFWLLNKFYFPLLAFTNAVKWRQGSCVTKRGILLLFFFCSLIFFFSFNFKNDVNEA